MHRVTEIKSEDDYRNALHLFVELCEIREKTREDMKTLLLLSDLMEKYERLSCGEAEGNETELLNIQKESSIFLTKYCFKKDGKES